mgnify:CR=1 FL=1|jgi:restriction modification system DNA specificity subunit
MAKLGEVCLLKAGKFVSANDISPEYNKGLYPCFGGNGIRGYVADYTHDGEFPLIGRQGALCGNVNLASGKFHATEHAVVVQPKIEMNVHWLYYALNAMNLGQYATGAAQPGLAVSKLETLSIEIPNISEQNKIAQTLYKVEQLVNFRKQQLAKLDELVKARFVEMFGNKDYPRMKWNNVFNTTTGKLDSNAAVDNGKYPFFTCSKEPLKIDSYAFDQTALLLAGNNAAGKYDVKYYQGKFNAYQRTYVLSLKHNWSYKLFQYQLEDKLLYLQTKSLGGLTKYLTLKILGELDFIVPPLALQNEFATFVARIDQQKQTVQQSLEKLELMRKALMQEYFG